jgi:hypothetical protein
MNLNSYQPQVLMWDFNFGGQLKIGSAYWKSFLRFYLIFGYQLFSLWPLKFELGHHIFGVDRQLATKIKIPH